MNAIRFPARRLLAIGAALLVPVLMLALWAIPTYGGGPRAVNGLGVPMLWNTSSPVLYNPDRGMLGTLSNVDADAMLASAFARWDAVPLAVIAFPSSIAELDVDVDAAGSPATNPAHWANYWRIEGDGYSPVIYDVDGSVIDDMFGVGARFDLLGVAGLDNQISVSGTIDEASIVINGAFQDGIGLPLSPEDSTPAGFEAIMVHEIGHFANLDHSVVNNELAADGDPENDIFLPTMYPLVVEDESAIVTLNPDDEAALAALYPTAGFAGSTAKVSGGVRSGGFHFQGANVVVRRAKGPATDRLMFAYSGISGATYFPCNPGGSCSPGPPPAQAGAYSVSGVAPGTYSICVEQIDRRLSVANGTFVGPLATPALLPGPEECYAASTESGTATDDPDDRDAPFMGTGANLGPFEILLNSLPVSDPFEPNNTLGTPAVLADLATGADTAGAVLGAGDLDFYQIPVVPGDIVRIDIDAAEVGSTLDPVIGLYDQTNAFLGTIDDSVDPDSGTLTLDPSDSFDVDFTGTVKLVVSSYPDLDADGVGGSTTGPYWIRVIVDHDADGDSVADRHDTCPFNPGDDADDDGRCENADNCDTVYNPTQTDTDADGVGVACDNCNPTTLTTTFNFQSGLQGWTHRALLAGASTWHVASTTCFGPALPSQMLVSNGNAGPGCSLDSTTEHSMLMSPPIILPSSGTSTLMFDALSFDEAGRCLTSGDFDAKDVGVSLDGGVTYTVLNNCTALTDGTGTPATRSFGLSPFNGMAVQIVFVYNTFDSAIGHTFAVDNVQIASTPVTGNAGQQDADGDGVGDPCDLCPLAALGDPDGDGDCSGADNCPTLFNPQQDGGARVRLSPSAFAPYLAPPPSFSPDGSRVYWLSDPNGAGVPQALTTAPSAGGTALTINPPLPVGGHVQVYEPSRDGTRVVYRANQDPNVNEIFSVPVTGGSATKLNGTMVTGGNVVAFRISQNSARVVYMANQDSAGRFDLYSVPLAGGTVTKLDGTLVAGGNVLEFVVSPDSQRVVFRADKDSDEFAELYSVPIGGGAITKLSDDPLVGPVLNGVRISPDSSRAIYRRVPGGTDTDMFSVPIAGGAVVNLDALRATDGDVGSTQFSADGARIVYRSGPGLDGVQEISSVEITGDAVTQLNPTLPAGRTISLFMVSAKGSRVVYLANQDVTSLFELYSVQIDGTGFTKLNGPLTPGGAGVMDFDISPDGARVVFKAEAEDSNPGPGLYSVPIAGGAVTELDGALSVDEGTVIEISPDGATVALSTGLVPDLYSVPITGGTLVKVNGSLASGSVENFRISPDNRRILYIANQDPDTGNELYTTVLVTDPDADGMMSFCDICPSVSDPMQSDDDLDGAGDACDNCPALFNPDQTDTETAAGPDMMCLTPDDRGNLFGPDGACGSPDDRVGDGVGDACVAWSEDRDVPIAGATSAIGAAWGDYDRDGDPDLFVARVGVSQTLLRNDAAEFVTGAALPPGGLTMPRGAAWADYDNDLDLDLYVSDANGASRLFRNDGMAGFADATAGPLSDPGFGYGVAWADYDNDGDVDLFHAKVDGTNKLFRNQGGGVFVDATAPPLTDSGQGRGVTWGDYDNDGDQDVYLVKTSAPNRLLRNQGGGVFVDATSPPLNLSVNGRGAAWGDYDNDGDLDLYVVNIGSSNKLFRNDGGGSFADVTSPPLDDTGNGTGLSWGDYDNDGDLDLYLANQVGVSRLFRNQGGTFTDATSGPLGSTLQLFCAAWADYDEDGDLDLFASNAGSEGSRLFRNEASAGNHWLHVDLKGRSSNRAGIGARVTATTAGDIQIREVSGGHGPGCQDSLTVEFGLGSATSVDLLEIRWPSGIIQTLENVVGDQRIHVEEPEFTPPIVMAIFPESNTMDVALSTNVIVVMSEPVNPLTATPASVFLTRNGLKVTGTVHVSTGGQMVVLDPTGPLQPDSIYVVSVNGLLRDLLGNPAATFSSGFDTTANATSGSLPAEEVGEGASGAVVPGTNANDQSGFSNAAVGDVNGDGLADLVVGAPNADAGSLVDAGKVTLVFGSVGLQSNATVLETIEYRGEAAGDRAGTAVSPVGDINGDGLADFLIGAPFASPHGTASGKLYLVLGNSNLDELAPASLSLASLAACATPTLCGATTNGEAAGDKAGASVAFGDDINNDGHGDLLIGAPGASPGARPGAGKVYLLYPSPAGFAPGAYELSDTSSGGGGEGVVFHGESAGDRAGESVSGWRQTTGDMIDDLIIGAPGADITDEFGTPIANAGYVYAIHGGTANLVSSPPGGAIIELSRVANGLPDQVDGVVFLGLEPGGEIGRSVTGTADVDGDGVADVVFGANQVAWVIPGNGPKTQSGQSDTPQEPPPTPTGLARIQSDNDAHSQFGAWFYSAGTEGDLGGLSVGAAGDVNADGVDDLVIGAGQADVAGKIDAGKAYIVYGSKIRPGRELLLSDVGSTTHGLVVQGFEAGDDLGRSVGGGLDLNADGVADALVGAPFADARSTTPPNAGETYVISPISPDEVMQVLVSQSGAVTTLEWTVPPRAIAYNVYRGDLGPLRGIGGVFTSNMVQLACGIVTDADADGLPDTATSISPPVGQGHYFLVTAESLMGEGPLGPPEQHPPRVNDSQCP